MNDVPKADDKVNADPDASSKKGLRNPFMRLALCAMFALTLPFTWGETVSCSGTGKPYTGIEQVTKNPGNIIGIIVIFGMPVVLGFVQYFLRPVWARVFAELMATMFAGVGTFYCFVSTILSGGLSSKSDRFYPAPLIATVVTFMMALHAFRGAIGWIAEMIKARRKVQPGG